MIRYYAQLKTVLHTTWSNFRSTDYKNLRAYTVKPVPSTLENKSFTDVIRKQAKFLIDYPEFRTQALSLWMTANTVERPLLITVMGEFKTGKSTFLNTLLGQEVLTADVTPATAVVTMLSYGEEEHITAHFENGSSREFKASDLADLTAEGNNQKKKLRNELRYVEVKLPIEILRRITLVDTPGLNVDNPLHIEATKNFMHEADFVLWLFAYGKVASKTEEIAIKELGARLKPLAVVNRIDEMDEEEETLEEVLQDVVRRLKDSIHSVYGLSSKQAQLGLKNNDSLLLEESGWNKFMNHFRTDVLDRSDSLLDVSIHAKANEIQDEVLRLVAAKIKKLSKQRDELKNHTATIQKLNERNGVIKSLQHTIEQTIKATWYIERNQVQEMLSTDTKKVFHPLQTLQKGYVVLEDTPKIVGVEDQMLLFEHQMNDIIHRQKEKQRKKENLQVAKNNHNYRQALCNRDWKTYNKSGFFGNRPLFDWNGEERRLRLEQQDINRAESQLESEAKQLLKDFRELTTSSINFNKEVSKYLKKCLKALKKETLQIQKKKHSITKNHNSQFIKTEQDLTRYRKVLTEVKTPILLEELETTQNSLPQKT